MTPTPGQLLDRYIFERRIGAGGMAEVWSARHQRLGTRHALKVLKGSDPALGRLLRAEGRAQAALDHPNLLPVHDILEFGGQPVLRMPFVDGPSLAALLDHYRPDRSQALAIFAAVTRGLDHAHSRGFIHRDLKPGNILLEPLSGALRPRIADFGLVLSAAEGGGAWAGYGTPAYTAPEQLGGGAVDARADLYSLGVLLVVLLTGRLPSDDPGAGPLAPDVALEPLARALLSPSPGSRPADCRAVLAALGETSDAALRDPALLRAAASLRPEAAPERAPDAARGPDTLPPRSGAGNLPAPRDGPLLGRGPLVAALADRLRGGERLVTITGAGGVGKTRVALAVARALEGDRPGGAWFVPLAEARDQEGIIAAVAEVLGANGRSLDQLGHAIDGRGDALLLLDNAEQIAEHAAEATARWMAQAPRARFLVTSREPLQVRGEHAHALSPLDEADAAALFADRAGLVRPGFALNRDNTAPVREIVRLVDGLPLAVELAAARAGMFEPAALLERLSQSLDVLRSDSESLPERQRTLRGTLRWSWDLLEPDEREILARSSVFEGGFTLATAQAVIAPKTGGWLEDVLADLVDRGLMLGGDPAAAEAPRLTLLNVVRQFAAGQLDDPEPVQARHTAHFARLGAHIILAARHKQPLGGWQADRADLAAAARRAAARGDAEEARLCALAAGKLFALRGPLGEGAALLAAARADAAPGEDAAHLAQQEAWLRKLGGDRALAEALLREALEMCGGTGREGHLLNDLGLLLLESGRSGDAEGLLRRALVLHRAAGDEVGIAAALLNIGRLLSHRGRLEEALDHLAQAAAIPAPLGNDAWLGLSLFNQGFVLSRLGRLEEASELYRRALDAVRAAGDRATEVYVLLNLGIALAERGDRPQALALYERAGALARSLGERRAEVSALHSAGMLRLSEARFERAEADLLQALALARGAGLSDADAVLSNLSYLRLSRGELEEAEALCGEALGLHRRSGNRINEAIMLGTLGRIRWLQGDPAGAAALLEQAARIHEEAGYTHGRCTCLGGLALLALDRGAPERALELARRASDLAAAYADTAAASRALEARALAGLGQIEPARQARAEAARLLKDSQPLATLELTLADAAIAIAAADPAAGGIVDEATRRAEVLGLGPRAAPRHQLAAMRRALG